MGKRISVMRLVVFAFAVFMVVSPALGADDPWTAPALSQDPNVLLKASESFPPNSKVGATILLNHMSFRFEQDGRLHHSAHVIYKAPRAYTSTGWVTRGKI